MPPPSPQQPSAAPHARAVRAHVKSGHLRHCDAALPHQQPNRHAADRRAPVLPAQPRLARPQTHLQLLPCAACSKGVSARAGAGWLRLLVTLPPVPAGAWRRPLTTLRELAAPSLARAVQWRVQLASAVVAGKQPRRRPAVRAAPHWARGGACRAGPARCSAPATAAQLCGREPGRLTAGRRDHLLSEVARGRRVCGRACLLAAAH
jgi:hypothetical protein